MNFRVFPALALLVGIAASGALGAGTVHEYRVPLMTKAPVIDGRLDPGEWSLACGFDGLAADGQRPPANRPAATGDGESPASDAGALTIATGHVMPVATRKRSLRRLPCDLT